MSESQRDETPSTPMVKKLGRQIRWDALAAIIASLVGMLALVVAGYTAHIQRQQVRAQVWPYLEYASSNVAPHLELDWMNKGVGPALIKSVEVTVDGKPQKDWHQVRESLGLPPFQFYLSTLSHTVVSPGQIVQWLSFTKPTDEAAFVAAAGRAKLDFEVCYCSTLGDCWRTSSDNNAPQAVGECRALPESRQFRDWSE